MFEDIVGKNDFSHKNANIHTKIPTLTQNRRNPPKIASPHLIDQVLFCYPENKNN